MNTRSKVHTKNLKTTSIIEEFGLKVIPTSITGQSSNELTQPTLNMDNSSINIFHSKKALKKISSYENYTTRNQNIDLDPICEDYDHKHYSQKNKCSPLHIASIEKLNHSGRSSIMKISNIIQTERMASSPREESFHNSYSFASLSYSPVYSPRIPSFQKKNKRNPSFRINSSLKNAKSKEKRSIENSLSIVGRNYFLDESYKRNLFGNEDKICNSLSISVMIPDKGIREKLANIQKVNNDLDKRIKFLELEIRNKKLARTINNLKSIYSDKETVISELESYLEKNYSIKNIISTFKHKRKLRIIESKIKDYKYCLSKVKLWKNLKSKLFYISKFSKEKLGFQIKTQSLNNEIKELKALNSQLSSQIQFRTFDASIRYSSLDTILSLNKEISLISSRKEIIMKGFSQISKDLAIYNEELKSIFDEFSAKSKLLEEMEKENFRVRRDLALSVSICEKFRSKILNSAK